MRTPSNTNPASLLGVLLALGCEPEPCQSSYGTQIAPGSYTISEGPEILKATGTVTVDGDTVVITYTNETGQQVQVTYRATLRGT